MKTNEATKVTDVKSASASTKERTSFSVHAEKKQASTANKQVTVPDVDIGNGVMLPQAIIDKLRTKDLRNLLLDLLNALFTKEDFASCSMSGKRGRTSTTANPELDVTKQQAILSKIVF